jgi:transposase-like protein
VSHGQAETAGVTKEFKAQALRIIHESGKLVSTVARELDLTETALRVWVRQAEEDTGRATRGALTTAERVELTRLGVRTGRSGLIVWSLATKW